jgi:hypothetical protein
MPPPYRPTRQPRVSIRYPFDGATAIPAHFVADGNARPRGGSTYLVEGQLFDTTTGNTPLSNKLQVPISEGIWTMGFFTDPSGSELKSGDYLLVVTLFNSGAWQAEDVITFAI